MRAGLDSLHKALIASFKSKLVQDQAVSPTLAQWNLLPPCAERAARTINCLDLSGTGGSQGLTPGKGSKLIAVVPEASTIATGASTLNLKLSHRKRALYTLYNFSKSARVCTLRFLSCIEALVVCNGFSHYTPFGLLYS